MYRLTYSLYHPRGCNSLWWKVRTREQQILVILRWSVLFLDCLEIRISQFSIYLQQQQQQQQRNNTKNLHLICGHLCQPNSDCMVLAFCHDSHGGVGWDIFGHTCPWGGKPGTHDVGSTENKADCTFIYLHVRHHEWIWNSIKKYFI